jgi:anti-anti-sigma factor
LSGFAEGVGGAMAATAVVASLVPGTGELRYACAGHPWPLLVDPDGDARYLREGRGVPLGCVPEPGYPAAGARLVPGATLLLYTDGLTERRGTDLSAALERLRVTAGEAAALPLEALLDAVVSAMGDEDAGDDVALLGIRLTGAPTDRHMTFPAELGQVPAARATVRTWLAELGVTGDAAADVLLAAGEAFANAVEHSGAAEVRLALTTPEPGTLGIEVEDAGSWRPPRAVTSRGRGLGMMRALVDELDVDSTATGTRVRMRHVVRPAAPAPVPDAVPGGCAVVLDGDVARLRGALDMASAATVGARLQPAVQAGLLIDLTAVDFLDSTGARLLLELAEAGSVRVLAPPGSPPRRTLELSGLDGVLTLVDQ